MYKNLLVISLLGIGGALTATEFVNFRPEISTEITETVLKDGGVNPTPTPNPNPIPSPNPTSCPYGCVNGVIDPQDGNPSYPCPCDVEGCPCRRNRDLGTNQQVEEESTSDLSASQSKDCSDGSCSSTSNRTSGTSYSRPRILGRIFRRR